MSTNATSTAVATTNDPALPRKRTLRDHLENPKFLAEIAKALPKHMKAERMARVAITAMTKTPALADCEPESFFKCLLDLSALGLEPDGRRAHLIPFKDNRRGVTVCTLIVDYKGIAELAYNSGVVSYLHADVVREGDLFKYSKGALLEHIPWFLRRDDEKPAEAGIIFAVYAMAKLKDGGEKVDVMSVSEIEDVMNGSQGYKAAVKYGKDHPWLTNWNEMAKKTAFRRMSKWLPLSPEVRDQMSKEDEEEERFSTAKKAKVEQEVQVPAMAFIAPPPEEIITAPTAQAEPVMATPITRTETAATTTLPATDNTLQKLASLMARDSVSEDVVMVYVQATFVDCDSLGSIGEVNDIKPSAISSLVRNWDKNLKAIKEGK